MDHPTVQQASRVIHMISTNAFLVEAILNRANVEAKTAVSPIAADPAPLPSEVSFASNSRSFSHSFSLSDVQPLPHTIGTSSSRRIN